MPLFFTLATSSSLVVRTGASVTWMPSAISSAFSMTCGGYLEGRQRRGGKGPRQTVVPRRPPSPGVPRNSPASQEDVVGPHHGEGHQALQLGAARRRQLPYVAQQELPAVPPVVLGLAGPAQRLRPGRLFGRPPQGLGRCRLPRHRRRTAETPPRPAPPRRFRPARRDLTSAGP